MTGYTDTFLCKFLYNRKNALSTYACVHSLKNRRKEKNKTKKKQSFILIAIRSTESGKSAYFIK